MTSSALTLKRHAYTARRRAGRLLVNSPVSINGTAPASYRRDDDHHAPGTPSNTAIRHFSTLERPIAQPAITRTSWRTSASSTPASGPDSTPSRRLTPLSLRSSSVDPAGSDLSTSRTPSASSRCSKVSPSDIIRLADDKLDRHRAAAAAAARRRFVLMTIGRTNRPTRWKNSPVTTTETDGSQLETNSCTTSLRSVPDSDCVLSHSTIESPHDDIIRLAQLPFSGLLRST